MRLENALERLDAGTLAPRAASAMASLAGALARVWEAGILEARLDRLEKLLEGLDGTEKQP